MIITLENGGINGRCVDLSLQQAVFKHKLSEATFEQGLQSLLEAAS